LRCAGDPRCQILSIAKMFTEPKKIQFIFLYSQNESAHFSSRAGDELMTNTNHCHLSQTLSCSIFYFSPVTINDLTYLKNAFYRVVKFSVNYTILKLLPYIHSYLNGKEMISMSIACEWKGFFIILSLLKPSYVCTSDQNHYHILISTSLNLLKNYPITVTYYFVVHIPIRRSRYI
jgi:hypothetical protein